MVRGGGGAEAGDDGAASVASRLMRVAEGAERRRFCGCERSRWHQKPPCAVKRQPPEGAAILPRKRLLSRPLVGRRRGFQFAVLPNFTVKRRRAGIVQNPIVSAHSAEAGEGAGAPNAAAGGIGLQRGFAALLMRFASRNAWRARAPFSPKWEMRGRRAQRAA